MNIVPMFMMSVIPWGIFMFTCGLTAFNVMYMRPALGYAIIGLLILFWVGTILVAINRRKYDPEPGWYTYFAIVTGIAIFVGWYLGHSIFMTYSFPFYQISDLKTIDNL